MSKEVVLTKEQFLEELKLIDTEISITQLKYTAYATAAMGAIKVGTIVVPKALTVLKGSTMILGLAVPNYFSIVLLSFLVVDTTCKFKEERKKAKEEKAKAKGFKNNELFELED